MDIVQVGGQSFPLTALKRTQITAIGQLFDMGEPVFDETGLVQVALLAHGALVRRSITVLKHVHSVATLGVVALAAVRANKGLLLGVLPHVLGEGVLQVGGVVTHLALERQVPVVPHDVGLELPRPVAPVVTLVALVGLLQGLAVLPQAVRVRHVHHDGLLVGRLELTQGALVQWRIPSVNNPRVVFQVCAAAEILAAQVAEKLWILTEKVANIAQLRRSNRNK